jgi:hypothetical protein
VAPWAGCHNWRDGRFFWELSDEGKQRLIDEMREDYLRHRDQVLEAWAAREGELREYQQKYFGQMRRPWAETEFG